MQKLESYRKKSLIIQAVQWFKNGDHPEDATEVFTGSDGQPFEGEGQVVRYYRHPHVSGEKVCEHCGKTMHNHGWIDTLEGGHIVCPADYIVTGVKGEKYPCKSDIFGLTYDHVEKEEEEESERPTEIRISQDGNQWCALHGANLHVGQACFGDTPHDALRGWFELYDSDYENSKNQTGI